MTVKIWFCCTALQIEGPIASNSRMPALLVAICSAVQASGVPASSASIPCGVMASCDVSAAAAEGLAAFAAVIVAAVVRNISARLGLIARDSISR